MVKEKKNENIPSRFGSRLKFRKISFRNENVDRHSYIFHIFYNIHIFFMFMHFYCEKE